MAGDNRLPFGAQLKRWRENYQPPGRRWSEPGLSLRELATLTGKDFGSISKIERNLMKPDMDFCAAIARVFRRDLNEVLSLAGLPIVGGSLVGGAGGPSLMTSIKQGENDLDVRRQLFIQIQHALRDSSLSTQEFNTLADALKVLRANLENDTSQERPGSDHETQPQLFSTA